MILLMEGIINMKFQSVEFEKLVATILSSVGYTILPEYKIGNRIYDIVANKDKTTYLIECKLSTQSVLYYIQNAYNPNQKSSAQEQYLIVLPFKDEVIKTLTGAWYCGKDFPNYKIWDISDLQEMLERAYEKAQNREQEKIKNLFNLLKDFTNNYYNINIISKIISPLNKEIVKEFYNEFESSHSFKKWKEFENFMEKFIEFYFSGYIGKLKIQKTSEGGLNRYDAIAPISIGENNSYFLDIVKNCFNCRYIIFEAKCYSGQITQNEIWRTSKYLHKSALRSVAIIITDSKCDKHCKFIQYGLLREQGKLIIVLEKNDIKTIFNAEENIIDSVLKQKIDELMMTLNA